MIDVSNFVREIGGLGIILKEYKVPKLNGFKSNMTGDLGVRIVIAKPFQ